MRTANWGKTALHTSRIGYGCMNLGGGWGDDPPSEASVQHASKVVDAALEQGIDLFDHADIYCRGKSELVFGQLLRDCPGLRASICLQSKCGIRLPDESRSFTVYDFRRAHIVSSVEGILRRLGTNYLDVLLLHRPDPLIVPEEVAAAFDDLRHGGKVRFFGVSNHSAAQIALLQRYVEVPIAVNQLELNIVDNALINQGVSVNQHVPAQDMTGTLEYCRQRDITVQAWAPLAKGYLCGRPVDPSTPRAPLYRAAAAAVAQMAERKGVSPTAICVAWILRHPARIQPIVGTTSAARIAEACDGDGVELSHEEWYELFIAGRGLPMP